MERITRKHLDSLAAILNRRMGFGGASLWTRQRDTRAEDTSWRNVATVGMFYIDGAYGGWALEQIVSEGGGVRDVFRCGHVPARELYGLIRAYLTALDDIEYGNIPAVVPQGI